MNDRYSQFYFNGVHSSVYNLFYVNHEGGLEYPLAPTFTQNFVSPMYQGVSYHLGTDYQQQVFNFTLAAGSLSNAERRAIFDWLNVGKPAYIIFDAFPNYRQRVIITNIGNAMVYPREWKNGLIENIVEFEIELKTVGYPFPETKALTLASSAANGTKILDTQSKLPIMIRLAGIPLTYKVINWTTIEQHVTFTANGSSITLSSPNGIIYDVNGFLDGGAYGIKVDGETGIGTIVSGLADNVGRLVEEVALKVDTQGPIKIPSQLLFSGKIKLDPTETTNLTNFFDENTIGPYEIAVLPPESPTTNTVVYPLGSDGDSKGIYPGESGTFYSPHHISTGSLSIPSFTNNWTVPGKKEYHVLVTRPYNLSVTGTLNDSSVQLSYRNRL